MTSQFNQDQELRCVENMDVDDGWGDGAMHGEGEEREGAVGSRVERHHHGDYPPHWLKMPADQTTAAVSLNPHSEEYAAVLCHFLSTNRLENVEVARIFRIQSSFLWSHYTLKKAEMKHEHGGGEVDERQLFHGTKHSNIDAICHKGFDWRLCGRHGIKFGQGCYFALFSGYSHVYSPKTGVTHTTSFLLDHPLPHRQTHCPRTSDSVAQDWDTVSAPLLKMTLAPYEAGEKEFNAHLRYSESLAPRLWSPPSTQPPYAFPSPFSSTPTLSPLSPFPSSSSFHGSSFPATAPAFLNPAPRNVFAAPSLPGTKSNMGSAFSTPTFMTHLGVGISFSASSSPMVPLSQSNLGGAFGTTVPGGVLGASSPIFRNTVGTSSSSFGMVEATQGGSDLRYMFLARVLVGHSVRGHKDYRRPPSVNPGQPYGPCFDSCVDDPQRPSIFVVFDSSQAYPEYLLEYRATCDNPGC